MLSKANRIILIIRKFNFNEVLANKAFLKNFGKLLVSYMCQNLFLIKLQVFKKTLWYMCFHVNFWKFFRTGF